MKLSQRARYSLRPKRVQIIRTKLQVTLEIHDVLGSMIKASDHGYEEANTCTISFDGTDPASGAHICRMTTDFGSRLIKPLLEK